MQFYIRRVSKKIDLVSTQNRVGEWTFGNSTVTFLSRINVLIVNWFGNNRHEASAVRHSRIFCMTSTKTTARQKQGEVLKMQADHTAVTHTRRRCSPED